MGKRVDPVIMAPRRGDRGGVVELCRGVHIATVMERVMQVRITIVRIRGAPGARVVVATGARVSRWVARSGVTYSMFVTLLTSH